MKLEIEEVDLIFDGLNEIHVKVSRNPDPKKNRIRQAVQQIMIRMIEEKKRLKELKVNSKFTHKKSFSVAPKKRVRYKIEGEREYGLGGNFTTAQIFGL